MVGLKTSTRLRAIMARRKRLISSSLLPENMGPQITSIHPTLPVMMSIGTVQHGTNHGRESSGRGWAARQRAGVAARHRGSKVVSTRLWRGELAHVFRLSRASSRMPANTDIGTTTFKNAHTLETPPHIVGPLQR